MGHAALIKRARCTADKLGARASVLTFDLHPDNLVLGRQVPLINSLDDRRDLITGLYGIDEMLVMHFTRAVQEQPWQQFVDNYLIHDHAAVHLVCGHDFCFGYRGLGTAQLLRERCIAAGVGCDIIPAVTLDGILVSSTYIRELLTAGDIKTANRFLGHPHRLSGVVQHGRHLGTGLGFPTANITIPPGILCPAHGAYATQVHVDGEVYAAVTNVGIRPTVSEDGNITVESWLLDYSGNLYDRRITVEFYERLRDERKFSGIQELKDEVLRNAQQTRALFG